MPDRQKLLPPDLPLRLASACAFSAWFWIVYFGCDWLAQGFAHRFSVHTRFDDLLPFVPALGLAYLLINPLLALPVFALRETTALLALCLTMAGEVAVAGVIFLIFPVEASITPAGHGSIWLSAADAVNLTYNCFPSLHVALAVSVGMALSPQCRQLAKAVLWGVVLLISASTVLTRQHFVADVVAGALLAYGAMRFLNPELRRWLTRSFSRDASRKMPPCPAGSPGYGSCSSDPRPGR